MAPRVEPASALPPRRRDVLAFGAGLALAPAVGWAKSTGSRNGELAVGFCGEAPEADSAVPVVAAGRLTAGDSHLVSGVRLTVDGLLGDLDRLPSLGIRSAELKVRFTIDAEPSEVEFRAWSFQLLPVEQLGSPIAFTVPSGAHLALALEVESFGIERFETTLVTGREPGTPKLRAGRYLISPNASQLAGRFDPAHSEPMIGLTVAPAA